MFPLDRRRRTEERHDFDVPTRLRLLEGDADQIESSTAVALEAMRRTLSRISAACIAILTGLVGALILLVLQMGGPR